MSDNDLFTSSPLFRIRGELIASVRDDRGEVMVIDNKVFRIMSFDRIYEQSKMQKDNPILPVHNYIRAMLMAVALTPVSRALVLGLGGGSLVRSLYARDPAIALEVVELRQAVLSVAQEHFHLPDSPAIHYQVGDAAEAVAGGERGRYQLIFSDLYSADAMAPLQTSERFLRHCADKLQDGGWLVLNHSKQPDPSSPFSQALQAIFRTLLYCTTPSSNVVIYACVSPVADSLAGLRRQMKASGVDFHTDFTPLAQKLAVWPGKMR